MPTDTQIAVMVEVAQSGGVDLNAHQQQEVSAMITERLIELSMDTLGKYRVTDHGQKMLDNRGVGANES